MRATLLGFTVPSDVMNEINASDASLSTQTDRFAWALVKALRDSDADVALLSVAPVSDYPRNPRLVWPSTRFEENGVAGILLPFVNLTVLKHVTRFISCWTLGLHELRRRRPEWLIVHGVHSPFLIFAVAVARRLGLRVAVVLTDPPGVGRAEDGVLVGTLKRLDVRIIEFALQRVQGVVVLAEPLARDFAPGVPYLVVEGLVNPLHGGGGHLLTPADGRVVVFAGGFYEEYGLRRLVDGFRRLREQDVRLELYGRGPLGSWLREQAMEDPRIATPLMVEPNELSDIYARATVLVQPRQVDQAFVPYSFPSKLIEYMASGTVTISTRLPSIPADYYPFVVWTPDDTPLAIADALRTVLGWTPEGREAFGAEAATFVLQTRGTASQGARIVKFLNDLSCC